MKRWGELRKGSKGGGLGGEWMKRWRGARKGSGGGGIREGKVDFSYITDYKTDIVTILSSRLQVDNIRLLNSATG